MTDFLRTALARMKADALRQATAGQPTSPTMRGTNSGANVSAPMSYSATLAPTMSNAISAAISAHDDDPTAHGGVDAEVVAARDANGQGSASLLIQLNAIWAAIGTGGGGAEWWWGTAAPASGSGKVNDFYLNVASGDVYEKTSSGWGTAVGNIQGPAGASGAAGPSGATGAAGANGADGASPTVAMSGDQLTINGTISGPHLTGPAGASGATGPQGIAGPTGATGATGVSGAAGSNGTNGQGFNWRGAWQTGNSYAAYDVTTYNGSCYECSTAVSSSSSSPNTDSAHFAVLASGGTGSGSLYKTTFTNASLSGGILTLTPGLGVQYPIVQVYDNNGNLVTPAKVTSPNTSQVLLDLTNYVSVPSIAGAHWWTLDTDTVGSCPDAMGTANGTVYGGVSLVAGVYNDGYLFDGSTGYVHGSDSGFPAGTAARTLMCWFKCTTLPSTAGFNYLFGYGTNSDSEQFCLVTYYNSSSPYNGVCLGLATGSHGWVAPWAAANTSCHHLAVALPSGASNIAQALIYLDGVLQTSPVGSTPLDPINTVLGGSSGCTFGCQPLALGGYFNGALDDIRLFPWQLTQPQICACMMQGALQGTWTASVRS